MDFQETDQEREEARIFWEEMKKLDQHREQRKKRILALLKKLKGQKFSDQFKQEMEYGVYPERIVRFRDIHYHSGGTNPNNFLHIFKNIGPSEYLQTPFNFGWQHSYLEDSYYGKLWFPLGGGKYLLCDFDI